MKNSSKERPDGFPPLQLLPAQVNDSRNRPFMRIERIRLKNFRAFPQSPQPPPRVERLSFGGLCSFNLGGFFLEVAGAFHVEIPIGARCTEDMGLNSHANRIVKGAGC